MMMNGRRTSPVVPIDQVPPADTSAYRPVVLVVDDESAIADTLTEILSRSGYAAMAAYDGNDALETALLTPPEMLITDVVLPGMSGIELAITIRRIFPDCKILLFSGQASTADLLTSAKSQGHHFTLLTKPVHPRDLLAYVSDSLKHHPSTAGATAG
ncbi:MAG TPA: response regulator [Terracidiphilus sp.]|nr:response regulator [Terracidiphilus sp.]